MSNFPAYTTKTFSPTQKFFVLDPNTGSPAFVQGSDLVAQLTPNSKYVYSESTRTTAQATDYKRGSIIQASGAMSVGDGQAGVYVVVAPGEGDFPMDNGDELLVIKGDEFLREQLAQDVSTGNGATLVNGATIYVGTVAELEALSLPVGTNAFLTDGDRSGDGAIESGAAPSDPENGIYVNLANGNHWKRRVNGFIQHEWFGAPSRTTFLAAVAKAVSLGVNRVITNTASLSLTTPADCQGCEIIGNQTVISSGSLINTSVLRGIIIQGYSSENRAIHPVARTDTTPKLIWRDTANQYYAITQKQSKGYILVRYQNNVTTLFESLAATTSDLTSYRVNGIFNCVDADAGYITASDSLGTWVDANNGTGIEEAFNAGAEYQYKQNGAGTGNTGNFYEMTVEVPADGFLSVDFISSGGSCTDISISVDGADVEANYDLSNAAAVINSRTFKVRPGTRTVRVTRNNDFGSINFLGCYYTKLKNARNDIIYDNYGYYRNTTNYDDYATNSSANDYAIRDADLDTWGGSYHGGETGITTKWLVNGTDTAFAVGDMAVCQSLILSQTFNIDWSGLGGPVLDCFTHQTFFAGGYSLESSFTGAINAESYFTTLFGVNNAFTLLRSPKKVDIATEIADTEFAYLGRQNHAVFQSGTTDQKLKITHTEFTNEENVRGGASVWRVVGSYHKYYYAAVDRGYRAISDISAVNVFEFE